MAFWFQPQLKSLDSANSYGNNGFLEKYWDADFSQAPDKDFCNDAPVFNSNSYFNSSFDVYSKGTNSYDDIIDSLGTKTKTAETSWQSLPKMSSAEPKYNEYFKSIFEN